MGLESLPGRRDKANLKWWYIIVAAIAEHRYLGRPEVEHQAKYR